MSGAVAGLHRAQALPWGAAVAAALLLLPAAGSDYLVSVVILALYTAYLGQAWNVMMGYTGLLSLGHALYVGVGAYTAAGLYVHLGVPPALGVLAAVAAGTAAGCLVGYLGFRFRVGGVYFALLTIAFAEFTRILFDHLEPLGGSAGLFLPVTSREAVDLVNLRGPQAMYYYVILALVAAQLLVCRALLRLRTGYYWQALRDDPEAAAALGVPVFRYRMYAVAVSSAMTSIGGVFYAFYYNNLYPHTVFSMQSSIEILLGPIIGGLGTLAGPVVGAFLLTGLGELLTAVTEPWASDGVKPMIFGFALLAIVLARPAGVWPWLRARLLREPAP